MEYPDYKAPKEVILKQLAVIYPPIEPYLTQVRWTLTDDGNLPSFYDVPLEVLEGLNKALQDKT